MEEGTPDIFDSKVGGAYYAPNKNVPTNLVNDEPMFLLAQLNFAQIPHLENFPEKGLLQIFISSGDLYRCDFDNPYDQEQWCVRYYEEVPATASADIIYSPQWTEETELPLMKNVVYSMKPIIDNQTISMRDIHFRSIADICLDAQMQADLENEEVVLLFQLDTVNDIMWGDSGVGNFFISKEDLKNRNFSHVLYNWDCL